MYLELSLLVPGFVSVSFETEKIKVDWKIISLVDFSKFAI
jgi:hypothetical protein